MANNIIAKVKEVIWCPGTRIILSLSQKDIEIELYGEFERSLRINGYHQVPVRNGVFNEEDLINTLKRVNMPDLGITYDLEYSRSRPVMGWCVENFHVPNIIPCWLTSKEMKLYKQLLKYSGTGRFSTGSGLWAIFNELVSSVAERYW